MQIKSNVGVWGQGKTGVQQSRVEKQQTNLCYLKYSNNTGNETMIKILRNSWSDLTVHVTLEDTETDVN